MVPTCRGRSGSAFLFSPFNGSSQVPSQPRFSWGYFGCNPVSQVLRLRYSGGGGDVPLAGSTRSYTLGFALPACSDVSWDIVSTDGSGKSHGTRSARFTTAGLLTLQRAATSATSMRHSGRASAGTGTRVEAGRWPAMARSRAAIAVARSLPSTT